MQILITGGLGQVGTQTRDFVSVYDVVNFVSLVLGKDATIDEVFNVGTGVATSVRELAEMIISLFEKDLDVVYASARKGDIKDSYADISKAKDVLGYKPEYSIEDGLEEIIWEIKKSYF